MKRSLVVALAACCMALHMPAQAEKVLLATGDWEPYTSQTMPGYGAFTEVVSAAFKEVGVQATYRFYPWKRAEYKLKAGEVFAIFPYIDTPERRRVFEFSDRVMTSYFVLFYRKDNYPEGFRYSTMADLVPYRIGGVRGYWYETPFREAGIEVDYANTDEQAIQKLGSKRVQFTAAGQLVGWTVIKRLYPDDVSSFATVGPLQEDPLRLMISRQYPNAAALTRKFNAGLKLLHRKGIFQQILARHGLKEGD